MALKEREFLNEAVSVKEICVGRPPQTGPCVLTVEESERILRNLSELPAPLSPELKQAIANYRRIKAERVW